MDVSDHDLLIELRGDVKALRDEVKEIKDNIKGQMDDHENRLRFLERWVWGAIAVISAAIVVIGWFVIYH